MNNRTHWGPVLFLLAAIGWACFWLGGCLETNLDGPIEFVPIQGGK